MPGASVPYPDGSAQVRVGITMPWHAFQLVVIEIHFPLHDFYGQCSGWWVQWFNDGEGLKIFNCSLCNKSLMLEVHLNISSKLLFDFFISATSLLFLTISTRQLWLLLMLCFANVGGIPKCKAHALLI